MKKNILAVDDSPINRGLIDKILSTQYNVILAENGEEAIQIIEEKNSNLAAIILDINMPGMDGFGLMRILLSNKKYINIPIIVATVYNDYENEMKALELGAWDFVSKPYHPQILLRRVENAIERSKLNMFEKVRFQAEHDPLTGIYNSLKFHKEVRNLLDKNPEENFAVVSMDILRFRTINDVFDTTIGDLILKRVASSIRNLFKHKDLCLYARIDADVFAFCMSYNDKDAFVKMMEEARQKLQGVDSRVALTLVFGVYFIGDRSQKVTSMIDRAVFAAKSCKRNYQKRIQVFSDEMEAQQKKEERIENEMRDALEQKQFCVYYQPKYNMSSSTPIGAEALVRWSHPHEGLISPNSFIPAMEKNGFISEVDCFVWEQTCKNLRKWIDEGFTPQPISVNISRVSLGDLDIVDTIEGLVKKYEIDPSLLQLEITETAYMDNPENMGLIVEQFHEKGFTILMDDFGSGYSSLNTLKDIPVDILKIDMNFLPSEGNNTKSEKILVSVIRMADWLGIPVIIEGVETKKQTEFLKSIGAFYAQGYYYAKPMPAEDYKQLFAKMKSVNTEKGPINQEILDAFLTSDIQTEALLGSISVPVAIYAFDGQRTDRIRANTSFYENFGFERTTGDRVYNVVRDEEEKLQEAFAALNESKTTNQCEILYSDGAGRSKWFRIFLRHIMNSKNGEIICAVYTEITQEKRAEYQMARIAETFPERKETRPIMLIVDDSKANRDDLTAIFSDEYDIIESKDGETGLTILRDRSQSISVILLNMIMKKMDGVEFLAQKNKMKNMNQVPVILISSDKKIEGQEGILNIGVSDYVVKPFVPEVVKKRVADAMFSQLQFSEIAGAYKKMVSEQHREVATLERDMLYVSDVALLIKNFQPIFDVVRMVDPFDTTILNINEDYSITREKYQCFHVWKKDTRCENCISACAVQNQCQMTKYEFIENDIFYVVSRPMQVLIDDTTPSWVTLEIVSHVSDSIMANNYKGITVREMVESTRKKIYCDPLTSAYNRRYLDEMLFLNHARFDTAREVAFVILDLNKFKHFNDVYGHDEGDRILVETVRALKSVTRNSDSIVRYGGDEFVVVLTNCPQNQIDRKVRQFDLAIRNIPCSDKNSEGISAKFGHSYISSFEPNKDMLYDLIRDADEKMYGLAETKLKIVE